VHDINVSAFLIWWIRKNESDKLFGISVIWGLVLCGMRQFAVWQLSTGIFKALAASGFRPKERSFNPEGGGSRFSQNIYLFTRWHNVTSQNTVVFTCTAMRTFSVTPYNTVEPSYNDTALCDTTYSASHILWYWLILYCQWNTIFSPFHGIVTGFNCDLLWFKWQIMPPAKDRIAVSKFLKQVFSKWIYIPTK